MLLKFSLVFLICGYFSSVSSYEPSNDKLGSQYVDQKNENDLLQTSYQTLSPKNVNNKLLKNCKQGNELNNDGVLVPTYSGKVVKPSVSGKNVYSVNSDLTPQSLKDGDLNKQYELKSENDPVLQYTPNQLLNVYVDRNEDTYDYPNKDKLLNKVNNEKVNYDPNLKEGYYKNKKVYEDVPKSKYPVLSSSDDQYENYKTPEDLHESTNYKYQPKSLNLVPKNVDNSLSSDEGESSEKCVKGKSTSSQENTLPSDSRRFLSTGNELPEQLQRDQDYVAKSPQDVEAQKNNYGLLNTRHSYNPVNDDVYTDPTRGRGISRLTDTKLMLSENARVCYACTSAASPNCLFPDRRTTVKYCRKGHNACVTKSYVADSRLIVIRDCARSCDTSGVNPKYESCSICHSDLCNDSNGAYSISSHGLAACLMIFYLIKCAF